MKTLIVIRHTKSDWGIAQSDFERPILSSRHNDPISIAQSIQQAGMLPQLVIASAATRATQSAQILCDTWGYPLTSIEYQSALYMCSTDVFSTSVKNLDDKYSTVAIVAHNPTVTDFVNDYTDTFIIEMPTTGAVCIHFDVPHWHEISKIKKGTVKLYLQPKELK